VFAQQVSGTGSPQWAADGVQLAAAANTQSFPRVVSDGTGGVIVCWQDTRNDPATTDIYAQRVSSSGSLLWTSAGAAVVTNPFSQDDQVIVADGSGGAVVVWRDNRGGAFDIRAQRMNPTGSRLWTTDGVVASGAFGDQVYPVAAEDGEGGAIVFWLDCRSDPQAWDVYAQRLLGLDGSAAWADTGLAICTAPNSQGPIACIPDVAGGAIAVWGDGRANGGDIYAQRVTASGQISENWVLGGTPVCTAPNPQGFPSIAADGNRGAILVWNDSREVPDGDPYITRVSPIGTGVTIMSAPRPSIIDLKQNRPNPFNPRTRISYELPSKVHIVLGVFDIAGHLVTRLVDRSESRGVHIVDWDGTDASGRPVASGVYVYRVEADGQAASRKMVLLK
jgi:hypothetical protein